MPFDPSEFTAEPPQADRFDPSEFTAFNPAEFTAEPPKVEAPPVADELGIGEEVRGVGRGVLRGGRRFVQQLAIGELRQPEVIQKGIEQTKERFSDPSLASEVRARQKQAQDNLTAFDNVNGTIAPGHINWGRRQDLVSRLAQATSETGVGQVQIQQYNLDRAKERQPIAAETFATQQQAIEKLPLTEAQKKFHDPATPWWNFFSNPVELSAISAAESAPMLAQTMAGAVGGPVGIAATAGAVSHAAESAGRVTGAMQEQGVNLKDPAAVMGWFTNRAKSNPSIAKADLAAIGPAAFDALTAGIAGRWLRGPIGAGKVPVAVATGKEIGTQMVGGGAGSITANMLAGEKIDWKDVVLEMAGELAPGEAIANVRSENRPSPITRVDRVDLRKGEPDATRIESPMEKVPAVEPAVVEFPKGEAGVQALQETPGARPTEAAVISEPAAVKPAGEERTVATAGTQPRTLETWADEVLSVDPRTQSQLGLDPRAEARRLSAVAVKGAALLQRGVTKFADWSVEMVKGLGEWVAPFLTRTWEKITGKEWDAELKSLSQEIITPTEADLTAMGQARNVLGQSTTARRLVGELTADPESARVLNRPGVRRVLDAVTALDEQHTNYPTLQADPNVPRSVKANATREALQQIEAFENHAASTTAGYESKRASLLNELKDVSGRREVAGNKKAISDALLSYFKTRGRSELRDSQRAATAAALSAVGDAKRKTEAQTQIAADEAALTAHSQAIGNTAGAQKTLDYISAHVPPEMWESLTSGQALVDHLKREAQNLMVLEDKTFEQVVGAPRDTIDATVRVVARSHPLRERLSDARELQFGERPFAELQKALRSALAGGDVRKAQQIIQSGIGKTAADRALSAKAAKLLLAQENRLLDTIRTLDETKRVTDEITKSEDYQTIRRTVLNDANVSDIIHGQDGTFYVLNPVRKGGESHRLSLSPNGFAQTKNLETYRKWKDEAMSYITDTDAVDFDPVRAERLEKAVRDTSWLANPANLPTGGTWMNSVVQKIQSPFWGMIGHWDKVARLTLNRVAGLGGELAGRKLTAWENALNVGRQVTREHENRISGAQKQAMREHGFGPDGIEGYREAVFNPLLASHQSFGEAPLKAGDAIGTGKVVHGKDVALLNAVLDWERSVYRHYDGEAGKAGFSILEQEPTRVVYTTGGQQKTRSRLDTGPNTFVRNPWWAARKGREWNERPEAERVKFLDDNLQTIVLGYVKGATEADFAFESKLAPELKTVFEQARIGQPLESFTDLVNRTEEAYSARPDVIEPLNVRDTLLSEIGDIFKRVAKAGEEQVKIEKNRLDIRNGTSSFNTARGRNIMPSLWYRYSSLTGHDQASFLNRGLRKFQYEYADSVEGVLRSMEELSSLAVEEKKAGVSAWQEGRAKQISGEDYYTIGQLRSVTKELQAHHKELQDAFNMAEQYLLAHDETGAAVQGASNYVVSSLLSGTGVPIINLVGATAIQTAFQRAVLGHYVPWAAARNILKLHASLANELLYRAGTANPALQNLLRHPDVRVFTANVSKLMADAAARTQEIYGEAGSVKQRKDLLDSLRFMAENRASGGHLAEAPATRTGRAFQTVAAGARMAGNVATHLLSIADFNRNVSLYRTAQQIRADLETRALKYVAEREASGMNPTTIDLTKAENRFSDAELRGRETGEALAADTPEVAKRFREFFSRNVGLDVDQLMWDYYRRHKEAVTAGADAADVRLLSEPQVRQLGQAIASYGNLPTIGTRPLQSSKVKRVASLFLGYPAYAKGLLDSYTQTLSTRTILRGRVGSLPLILGLAGVLALFGTVGMQERDWVNRVLMGRHTQVPTILNAQTPNEVAKAIVSGWGSLIPLYGTIANNIAGTGARNGFDVNSQFVWLNFATDMLKTAREVYMTGDAELPTIRLAERYVFPANYLARLLPDYSGLKQNANERNDWRVAARNAGLDGLLRQSGGATDLPDYGPATPVLNEFSNAVGNRDMAGAQAAFQKLVQVKAEAGSVNPLGDAMKAVRSRNPVSQTFASQLSPEQLQQVVAAMPAADRAKAVAGMQFFDSAVQAVGGSPVTFTKSERGTGGGAGGGFGRSSFGRTRRGRVGRGRRPGRIRSRVGRTRRSPRISRRRR